MRRLTVIGHAVDELLLTVLLRLDACIRRAIRAALLRQDAREIASIMEIPTCGKR